MSGPLVVAYGGGVNSTAMLVGMRERGIRPDLIIFADTGGERPETYKHVVFMRVWALREMGVHLVTVRASQRTDRTLEENCLRRDTLPAIAFGWKTCSIRWKAEPSDQYLSNCGFVIEAWERGEVVQKAIGFDAGEPHRVKDFIDAKFHTIYPLVEWRWFREDCVAAINRAGIPLPPKSACFFCPSTKKHEVLQLQQEHPDLLERALEIERRAAPHLETVKGLGRRWSWAELLQADADQFKMLPEAPEEPCGCYDGESVISE